MRKTLTAAMAALTFGGAVAAAAVPAQARGYEGGRYYGGDYRRDYRGDNNAGVAVAAGIVGLALGAALTSGNHSTSYGSYGYAQPYYGSNSYTNAYGGYDGYYGGGYRTCESRRWVYDRYIGREVLVTSRYAC